MKQQFFRSPQVDNVSFTQKLCYFWLGKYKYCDTHKALYDFIPQEHGELEFRRGDVITVTDKADQHWWTGELGNRRGLFPATYVTPYHTS